MLPSCVKLSPGFGCLVNVYYKDDYLGNVVPKNMYIDSATLDIEARSWSVYDPADSYVGTADNISAGAEILVNDYLRAQIEAMTALPFDIRPFSRNIGSFEALVAMAASVHTITAIKHVRALTGWGLKEAKDYVEKVKAEA